jgi:hypothetical protein
MRWLFLLLLVLNGCYLVWNLQDAPVRAKDISLAAQGAKGSHGIQLLSEAGSAGAPGRASGPACDFIGGVPDASALRPVAQRLHDIGVPLQAYVMPGATGDAEHWLRLPPGATAPHASPDELTRDIKGLRHEIIQCEGIATPEQFE